MIRSALLSFPPRRLLRPLALLTLFAVTAGAPRVSAEPQPPAAVKPAPAAEKPSSPAYTGPPLTRPAGLNYSILPPPPADDTPAGLADLNVLLYVQASRTPEMVAMARRMAAPSVFAMNQAVFGAWFTRDNLPKTAAILREATKVTSPILNEAKAHWKRPRPYVRSAAISPVVGKPGDAGSYPSGHSFGIAVPEFILAEAFPQHTAALDAKVREVMWGRIVGGVHFPSDTEAGRLLGRAVVTELAKTPAMREALEIIRQEAAPFLAGEKTGLPAAAPAKGQAPHDSTRPAAPEPGTPEPVRPAGVAPVPAAPPAPIAPVAPPVTPAEK